VSDLNKGICTVHELSQPRSHRLKFPLVRQENSATSVSNYLFQFIRRSSFRWIDLFGPTPQNETSEAILVVLGELLAIKGYGLQPKCEQ